MIIKYIHELDYHNDLVRKIQIVIKVHKHYVDPTHQMFKAFSDLITGNCHYKYDMMDTITMTFHEDTNIGMLIQRIGYWEKE